MPTNQDSLFNPNPVGDIMKQFQSEPSAQELSGLTQEKTPKILSFGDKLVGLTFNPSGDDKVAKAKQLCSALMDLVENEFSNREQSKLSSILYNHTVGEILNAQMNVVKLLTLKY